jgi:uncharacterized protein YdaU (DUF1376 family)
VGDYLRDTRNLDTTEHGAYLLLLMTAWSQGGEISAERKEQYRLAAAATPHHRKAVDRVIERYWKNSPIGKGRLMNPRLQRELARAQDDHEAQSEAGKRSAAMRRERRSADNPPTASASSEVDRLASGPAPATRPDQTQGNPPTPPASPQDFSNPSSPPSSSFYASGGGGDDDEKKFHHETTPGAGDLIRYTSANSGEFIGITDARMTAWQETFGASVPMSIRRAALWLYVSDRQRRAIERAGKGFESFITRWLEDEKGPVGTRKLREERVK